MTGKRTERVAGIDQLRFVMILCVVALHAAMTYMKYVPEWWYVIDPRRSIVFTILVIVLDTFPMSVLFFLAGFFTPHSFDAKGATAFLKAKALRLGVPWLLGLVLIVPFLALATMRAYGIDPASAGEFLSLFLFTPFYQQGPFWFLSTLAFFMLCYAVWRAVRRGGDACAQVSGRGPVALVWALVGAATAAGYWLSVLFLMPADQWLNLGDVLYFQPARITGYALLFFLGMSGFRRRWFFPDGWRPNLPAWGLLAAVGLAARGAHPFLPPGVPAIGALVDVCSYALAAVATTVFLVAVFTRPGNKGSLFRAIPRASSFGVYWLHMPVLMPVLALFRGLPLPAPLLWAAAVAGTTLFCHGLTVAVLKKAPGLRNVF